MIRYALECACGERFEAWFRNATSCDDQLKTGVVTCPVCAGSEVSKALMAPSVPKREAAADPVLATTPAEQVSAPETSAEGPNFAAFATRAIEQKLRALRAHVEATAEPVGKNFANEARAIHEGEAEERAIYGEATPKEAEELLEDGVPVAPIPWIDKQDD